MKTIFKVYITMCISILFFSNVNAQTSECTETKTAVKEGETVTFNHNYKQTFNKPQAKKGLKVKESKGDLHTSNYKHQAGKKVKKGTRLTVESSSVRSSNRNYKHQVPLKRGDKL